MNSIQKENKNSRTLIFASAIFGAVILLPITGITGIAFMASAVIAVLAGILNIFLSVIHIDFPLVVDGRPFLPVIDNPFLQLIACVLIAVVLWFAGKWLWTMTVKYVSLLKALKAKL